MAKRSCLATVYFVGLLWIQFRTSHTAGAGRAFPIEAENYAIQNFKQVNPRIEWDPTNFLTDLAGNYANCNYLHQTGEVKADRKTPEGQSVTVFIDTIEGKNGDVDSVDKFLRDLINRWMSNRVYHSQISQARRIGCSVRASCSGYAVVACTTSTGDPGPKPIFDRPSTKDPRWQENPKKDDNWWQHEQPKALAFTPEQYRSAEAIMGKQWDRAHFLENLSGFETDCAMIGRNDWPFEHMKKMMKDQNMKLIGQYGSAPNKGSTPDAMSIILRGFKSIPNARSIGCSIIPHCRTSATTMAVVIGCLYEEN